MSWQDECRKRGGTPHTYVDGSQLTPQLPGRWDACRFIEAEGTRSQRVVYYLADKSLTERLAAAAGAIGDKVEAAQGAAGSAAHALASSVNQLPLTALKAFFRSPLGLAAGAVLLVMAWPTIRKVLK